MLTKYLWKTKRWSTVDSSIFFSLSLCRLKCIKDSPYVLFPCLFYVLWSSTCGNCLKQKWVMMPTIEWLQEWHNISSENFLRVETNFKWCGDTSMYRCKMSKVLQKLMRTNVQMIELEWIWKFFWKKFKVQHFNNFQLLKLSRRYKNDIL